MRSAQSTSYRYIRARSLFIPVTYYSEHVIPYPYDIINDQPQESFPIGIWLLQIKCVGADVETNIIRNKFCANTKHTHVQYTHTHSAIASNVELKMIFRIIKTSICEFNSINRSMKEAETETALINIFVA